MTPRFDGKTVLITGTGGGIGRSSALMFAAAGAHVVGCDLKVDANRETAEMIRAAGGVMTAMEPVDLGDPAQAEKWVDDAVSATGRIDILYNNAGATRVGGIETLPLEDWHFGIRNEVDLVFTVTKRAWPHLRKQGGVVLNTGSIAATHSPSDPPYPVHNTGKGAIVALSRALAVEGSKDNIRVVCISPGIVETPVTAPGLAIEARRERFMARNLVKRIGQPEDVAAAALFLASAYASYITGTNLMVDGGYTAS